MVTDDTKAITSANASQSQISEATVAQASNAADSAEESPAQQPAVPGLVDADSSEAEQEAEPEAASATAAEAAPVTNASAGKQSFSFKSVIDQTMKRHMGSVYSVPGQSHVGQGFAKWLSRAVGSAALKERTELEDLPAYKMRVSQLGMRVCQFDGRV